MDRTMLAAWIAAYERAWRTAGTEELSELFTEDATYSTAPFEAPHRGLSAIARMWEAEREGADETFTMTSEILAVEQDTGVARVEVEYLDGERPRYRDLWVVRLDGSGRCRAFEEWPFWPPGTEGTAAAGASTSA